MCMPCKPIRRKYSKNEVILPSDQRGSMACHAVPRVMMYQGDARAPLGADAILRGLRWWWTDVWNNGCFVRLGRCDIVIWRLIAHYYYYWGGTTGVRPPCCSALLFGAWLIDPVAICPTCWRRGVHNSWKRASTEEYKKQLGFLLLRAIHRYKPRLKKGGGGSFPAQQAGEFGIVYSRQGGRKGNKKIKVERLSFGKIWFCGVCTH